MYAINFTKNKRFLHFIFQVPASQVSSIQSNLQDPAISSVVSAISSYYGAQFVDFENFDMTSVLFIIEISRVKAIRFDRISCLFFVEMEDYPISND